MLTIYTHKKSNRLLFVLDFILREHMGLKFRVTTDSGEFRSQTGPKINYSMENFEDKPVTIFPVLLLFQGDVTEHKIEVKEWDGIKTFYNVEKGDLPFDIFAATFFMITRYEEYLYAKKDRFGRYDPRNSLAWKYGFLYQPIVNTWLQRFIELLNSRYPGLQIAKQQYRYIPTIDVDNAWAYLHKGFLRTLGGLTMNMLRHRFHNFGNRVSVILGRQGDPYDTYAEINRIHQKHNLKPYIFFLLGNYGGFDRAISPENKYYRELIRYYAQQTNVGIHSSFASYMTPKHLKEEIEIMDDITDNEVIHNRFHFIKFAMPKSYEQLITNGISNDFSMGYPSRPGFRTGYAGSCRFFNLKRDQPTKLRIYPFQLMDATLKFYSKHSPDEAYNKSVEIIDKIKAVNGTLLTVWHNESLSGIYPWKGWENLYERIVDYAVPKTHSTDNK